MNGPGPGRGGAVQIDIIFICPFCDQITHLDIGGELKQDEGEKITNGPGEPRVLHGSGAPLPGKSERGEKDGNCK